MATPGQQPEPYSSDQIRELMTFLRQESVANKDHLRNQAEADRELLKHTLWIVALPLTALITVAGIFGFRSVSDLKDTIRTQAQTETKTEIARMQADTEKQIKAMQGEIRNRLDDQFKGQIIRDLVKEAAKDQAQATAKPLIQREVATQVRRQVDAEQGNIRHTVTVETQTAVKQMDKEIGTLVKSAVDSKVQTEIQPVAAQVGGLRRDLELQRTINRVNEDDARALDELFAIPLNVLRPDEQRLVKSAVRTAIEAHDQGIFRDRVFKIQLSGEELINKLSSDDAWDRQAALDTLRANPKNPSLLPRIVSIMLNDPSLNVRVSAYRLFNAWTGQQFQSLDKPSVVNWWNQHHQEFAQ